MMDILTFLLIAGTISISGLLFARHQGSKQYIKELEKKKELEGQKYEHLKEILVDAAITSNPAAVEALKPITEAIARDISGEKDHQRRLAEIEARNEPFRLWSRQVKELCEQHGEYPARLERSLTAIQQSTCEMFPNLQLPESSEKLLTQGNKDDDS